MEINSKSAALSRIIKKLKNKQTKEKMEDSGKEMVVSEEVLLGLEVLKKNGLDLASFSQLLTEDGDYRAQRIKAILNEPVSKYCKLVTEWEKFYMEYFNVSIDLKGVAIPEPPKHLRRFNLRLLFIVPAISVDRVMKSMRKYFKVKMEVSGPTGKLINVHARHETYAVWVIDSREPLKDLRSKSAGWAKENKFVGETFQERLLHGFKYWSEKNKQLDVHVMTTCSGTRLANGLVPFVSSEIDSEGEDVILITQNNEEAAYPIYGLREVFR